MNRYICTFGANQEHEGKYMLVIAPNMDKAIDKMYEVYGNEWCMCYSEEQWNNTPSYIPRETLLRTIVVPEEVEEERIFYCPKCGNKLDKDHTIFNGKTNEICTFCYCDKCLSEYRVEEDNNNFINVIEYMKGDK